MADEKLYVLASDVAISEQKSNDIFLLVEMRILSTQPNGNAEGVTPQFIDEVVAHPEKYACLPLYADVERLLSGDYLHLGHMYNADTGTTPLALRIRLPRVSGCDLRQSVMCRIRHPLCETR